MAMPMAPCFTLKLVIASACGPNIIDQHIYICFYDTVVCWAQCSWGH